MVAKMTTSVMMMAYRNCPIKALPVLPKIVVNRFWIAVFHARAATSPKATVINSANLSRTSAVTFSSFSLATPYLGSRRVVTSNGPRQLLFLVDTLAY
jgi:hypothetical protein